MHRIYAAVLFSVMQCNAIYRLLFRSKSQALHLIVIFRTVGSCCSASVVDDDDGFYKLHEFEYLSHHIYTGALWLSLKFLFASHTREVKITAFSIESSEIAF